MTYDDYVDRFQLRAQGTPLTVRVYGEVLEGGKPHPLLCAQLGGEREVVITAGFHGEEPAGPLTLLERLEDVVAHAKSRNIALRIYPCVNPSGFERRVRYNASGERPNNDFLRYEVAPGQLKGELAAGESFLRHLPYLNGPKETRALLEDLEQHATPVAALDIHQDNYMPGAFTYAYVFGDRAPYRALAQAAAAHVSIAAHAQVDEHHRTDDHGLVEFHDGSVTDYFLRRGSRYAAALETTTSTPLERCHGVNLLWIQGFIDLATT